MSSREERIKQSLEALKQYASRIGYLDKYGGYRKLLPKVLKEYIKED